MKTDWKKIEKMQRKAFLKWLHLKVREDWGKCKSYSRGCPGCAANKFIKEIRK